MEILKLLFAKSDFLEIILTGCEYEMYHEIIILSHKLHKTYSVIIIKKLLPRYAICSIYTIISDRLTQSLNERLISFFIEGRLKFSYGSVEKYCLV